jgi:hypothetical protein
MTEMCCVTAVVVKKEKCQPALFNEREWVNRTRKNMLLYYGKIQRTFRVEKAKGVQNYVSVPDIAPPGIPQTIFLVQGEWGRVIADPPPRVNQRMRAYRRKRSLTYGTAHADLATAARNNTVTSTTHRAAP